MRTQKIFSRLLVPVMVALLLLPPLSCLIFQQAAKRYAYNEAVQELKTLQERIMPIMEHSFSAVGEDDPIKSFLGKVGPLASQMGGSARLMILAGQMQVIYPRDEQLRQAVTPLAEEFRQYIQDNSTLGEDAGTLTASDGETYLVNIYEAPVQSQRLRYIITYCPASRIGGWVTEAAALVLAIASVFVVLVFTVLWTATRSITQPLHRLCREAGRIGGGSFTEMAVQKGISLTLVPFEKSIMVYGEEELLGKVLENLLTNAIRYAKTTVTISVKAEKGQAAIFVTDDGDGIDEKDLPHLFERCYKGRDGNFGIGLAIAHSAAEKMGGHLEATNQCTGGAAFRLFLKVV